MSRQPKRGTAGDEPSRTETGTETAPSGQERRRERIRRPEPERVYPDRSPSGLFRREGPENPGDPESEPGSNPGSNPGRSGTSSTGSSAGSSESSAKDPFQTIERGVREGYRVVEDYLREGQRVARQINRRQYGPRQMGDDLQSLTGRMFRDSTRLLALWLELMSSSVDTFWGAPRRGGPRTGRTGPTDRSPEAPPPSPEGDLGKGAPGQPADDTGERAVAVEITSPHPARVTVHLAPGAAREPLRPTPLSGDPEAPLLTDVTFEPGGPDEPPVLRLRVPAEQPPGSYHGLLVEPTSQGHRGTVKVELREASQASAKTAPHKSGKDGKDTKGGGTRRGGTEKSSGRKGSSKKSATKKRAANKGASQEGAVKKAKKPSIRTGKGEESS